LSGCRAKRAVIEEALCLLTRMKRQEQVRALRGKLHWEGIWMTGEPIGVAMWPVDVSRRWMALFVPLADAMRGRP